MEQINPKMRSSYKPATIKLFLEIIFNNKKKVYNVPLRLSDLSSTLSLNSSKCDLNVLESQKGYNEPVSGKNHKPLEIKIKVDISETIKSLNDSLNESIESQDVKKDFSEERLTEQSLENTFPVATTLRKMSSRISLAVRDDKNIKTQEDIAFFDLKPKPHLAENNADESFISLLDYELDGDLNQTLWSKIFQKIQEASLTSHDNKRIGKIVHDMIMDKYEEALNALKERMEKRDHSKKMVKTKTPNLPTKVLDSETNLINFEDSIPNSRQTDQSSSMQPDYQKQFHEKFKLQPQTNCSKKVDKKATERKSLLDISNDLILENIVLKAKKPAVTPPQDDIYKTGKKLLNNSYYGLSSNKEILEKLNQKESCSVLVDYQENPDIAFRASTPLRANCTTKNFLDSSCDMLTSSKHENPNGASISVESRPPTRHSILYHQQCRDDVVDSCALSSISQRNRNEKVEFRSQRTRPKICGEHLKPRNSLLDTTNYMSFNSENIINFEEKYAKVSTLHHLYTKDVLSELQHEQELEEFNRESSDFLDGHSVHKKNGSFSRHPKNSDRKFEALLHLQKEFIKNFETSNDTTYQNCFETFKNKYAAIMGHLESQPSYQGRTLPEDISSSNPYMNIKDLKATQAYNDFAKNIPLQGNMVNGFDSASNSSISYEDIEEYDERKFLNNALGEHLTNTSSDNPSHYETCLNNTPEQETSNQVRNEVSIGSTDISLLLSEAENLYSAVNKNRRRNYRSINKNLGKSTKSSNDYGYESLDDLDMNQKEIKLVMDDVRQNEIITQISKAVRICRYQKYLVQPEILVEAEKILLIANLRKTYIKEELQKLMYEDVDHQLTSSSLRIKNLELVANTQMDLSKNNLMYHYVIVVRQGSTVFATKTVMQEENVISFPDKFHFDGMPSDFELSISVYGLTLKNRKKSKIIPKSREKLKTLPLSSCLPTKSCFELLGSTLITPPKSNQIVFGLNQITTEAPVLGLVKANIETTFRIHIKESGFLTIGVEYKDHPIWNRRWCYLSGSRLRYWNHPSEQEHCEPIADLDLLKCAHFSVERANKDICPNPKTLLLKMLATENGRTVEKRYFLAADSLSDLQMWQEQLNLVLTYLKKWSNYDCFLGN